MVNVTSTYLTATQVMEILGVSRATAYKTIHELNEELQQNGYRIIAGKVPAKYFEEKYEVFYGRKQNQSHADRRRGQRKTTGKCNRKQEAQTDSKCPDPVVLYSRPGDGVRGIRYK